MHISSNIFLFMHDKRILRIAQISMKDMNAGLTHNAFEIVSSISNKSSVKFKVHLLTTWSLSFLFKMFVKELIDRNIQGCVTSIFSLWRETRDTFFV